LSCISASAREARGKKDGDSNIKMEGPRKRRAGKNVASFAQGEKREANPCSGIRQVGHKKSQRPAGRGEITRARAGPRRRKKKARREGSVARFNKARIATSNQKSKPHGPTRNRGNTLGGVQIQIRKRKVR